MEEMFPNVAAYAVADVDLVELHKVMKGQQGATSQRHSRQSAEADLVKEAEREQRRC